MGLLIVGKPMTWEEMRRYKAYVKKHGILQFINIWRRFKDREQDKFLWGDEIEGVLIALDPAARTARIALRAHEVLQHLDDARSAAAAASLEAAQQAHAQSQALAQSADSTAGAVNGPAPELVTGSKWNVTFHPEYGNFMVEATPGFPYGGFTSDLRLVELNMRLRRALISAALSDNERFCTLTNFPLLGTTDFATSNLLQPAPAPATAGTAVGTAGTGAGGLCTTVNGPVLKSSYVPDCIMAPHPRFATLSGNIRRRRGRRVNIKHPLFIDSATDLATAAGNVPACDERPELRARDDEVHMDAMGFGMGCCCLQVTFQTRSLNEARTLYDQLAVLAPVFLALTANTPFHRGRIVDTDVRWDTISASVDDRTDEERGLSPFASAADAAAAGVTPAPPLSPRADAADSKGVGMPSLGSVLGAADLEANAPLTAVAAAAAAATAAIDEEDEDFEESDQELDYVGTDLPSDTEDTINDAIKHDNADPHNMPLATSPSNLSTASSGPCSKCPPDEHPTVGVCAAPPYGPIAKSRYSSVDCYIARDAHYRDEYNDLPFKFDAAAYARLRRAGVDCLLAKHTASLFVRDPLVMFQGKILQDDALSTDHFESIQSTNWRSVRFKPPPANAPIGWRVEFRTMEVQLTDYENAAFTVFIALLTRAISFFDLNFYVPMSKVEDNFRRAHKRDAVRGQKFWFRRSVRSCPAAAAAAAAARTTGCNGNGNGKTGCGGNGNGNGGSSGSVPEWESSNPALVAASWAKLSMFMQDTDSNTDASASDATSSESIANASASAKSADAELAAAGTPECGEMMSRGYLDEMTMAEVICGKPPCFPGLAPLVRYYLDVIKCDPLTRSVVDGYLALVEARARGELLTGAAWQRQFVAKHAAYKHDSVLPRETFYDLAVATQALADGSARCPELLGAAVPAAVPAQALAAARAAEAVVRARVAAARAGLSEAQTEAQVAAVARQAEAEAAAAVAALGGVADFSAEFAAVSVNGSTHDSPVLGAASPSRGQPAANGNGNGNGNGVCATPVKSASSSNSSSNGTAAAATPASPVKPGAPEVITLPAPPSVALCSSAVSNSGSRAAVSGTPSRSRDKQPRARGCGSGSDNDGDDASNSPECDGSDGERGASGNGAAVGPVKLRGASFVRDMDSPQGEEDVKRRVKEAIVRNTDAAGLPGSKYQY